MADDQIAIQLETPCFISSVTFLQSTGPKLSESGPFPDVPQVLGRFCKLFIANTKATDSLAPRHHSRRGGNLVWEGGADGRRRRVLSELERNNV